MAEGNAGAWLRPFDELAVGDRHVSRRRTVTTTDVVRFGRLTKEGRLDMATPQLLPLTYSIGLVPNVYVSALRRIVDLVFAAPVRAGDTIHVECEIVRLAPWTSAHGLVTGTWRIVDQRGRDLMTVELEAVWRR